MDTSTLANMASACKDPDVKSAMSSTSTTDLQNIANSVSDSTMADAAKAGKDAMNTMMKEGQTKLDTAGSSYIEGAFDSLKKSMLDIFSSVNMEFAPLAMSGKMLAIAPNFIEAPSASGYATGRATQEFTKTLMQQSFFM
jgi:hypothetical protein